MNLICPQHTRRVPSLPLLFTLPFVLALDSHGTLASAETSGPAAGGGTPMKTIGVIGGIGPQATMDFETRVHRVAQRLVEPHYNAGYPPLIVYYHRRPPIVVGEDGMPISPLRIDPDLMNAAAHIGPLVDFLVITSNGAHRVAGEIERASGRPVLSMVARVVEEVGRRKWSRVGLMTLGRPAVYAEPLERHGIAYETLDEARQAALDRAIFAVMEGREGESAKRVAREALASRRTPGVVGGNLGCSELPFLVEPTVAEADLINPIELLAEAAVALAIRPASSAGFGKR
jgi:aspartate racemase